MCHKGSLTDKTAVCQTSFDTPLIIYGYYDSILHHTSTDHIKPFHDICLVRSPENAGTEMDRQHHSPDRSDTDIMGHSAIGVLLPGSRQPHRFSWKRGTVHTHATQGDTGGCHTHRIHTVHCGVLQRRATALESFCSVSMPHSRRMARIPQIISAPRINPHHCRCGRRKSA